MWDASTQQHNVVTLRQGLEIKSADRLISSFKTTSRFLSLVVALVGFSVLTGWFLDITLLKGVLPGLATMKANTALCFLLAGISLWLFGVQPGRTGSSSVGRVFALIVLLVGLLTLFEYVFDLDLGIDESIIKDSPPVENNPMPGRMSPATALTVLLVGISLIFLFSGRSHRLIEPLVLLSAFSSALALLGYLYNVSSLYRITQFSSVALHTAAASLLLSLGILFARPDRGLMAVISGNTTGGILVRRLLPVSIFAPVVGGWVRLLGQRAGLYDTEFGLSLMVILMILILAPLILSTGKVISEIDVRRRAAEDATRASEERFFKAFSASPVPMSIVTYAEGRYVEVNDSFLDNSGYSREEIIGRTTTDISLYADPEERTRLRQILETEGGIRNAEVRRRMKSGEVRVALASSEIIYIEGEKCILTTTIDITERKQLEQQLLHAQKMEAIGRLAGGVAHDFNNLLTAIIGYSHLIQTRLDQSSPLRREAREIEKAGERAASLTSQLLAFSRKQVLQPKVLDLNEVISGIDRMLRRLIGEDIDLVTNTRTGLGRVKVDPGQVEQVIMNLAVNARDAMPRGGNLTIETMNAELDENYASSHAEVRPGRYVMLAVSDTGHGMDSQTISRIFEPFFTTKEKGKGTGLGLSMVYGIVKQSGGHVWVYSEPGKGATFKIYFPRVDEVAERNEKVEVINSLKGSGVILLVEDDEMVREFARLTLEFYGYTVLEASDAEQAMEKSREFAGLIDLMVTDVVMPGLSGRELSERLRQFRPEIKVLYISGYTDNAIARHGVLDMGMAFLQKPFTPEGLARKVAEVLNALRS